MKRTKPKIGAALFLQLHISGNHIHDVILHPHFFDHIFRIIHPDLPKKVPYMLYIRQNFLISFFMKQKVYGLFCPCLRDEIFSVFFHRVVVCHSGNIITDHLLPAVPGQVNGV